MRECALKLVSTFGGEDQVQLRVKHGGITIND
jgi:hypothetical protein